MEPVVMKIEQIVVMAEEMAQIHRGQYGGGDPQQAFADFGIQYTECHFPDAFDGLLRYKNGAFQVFVNTSHARTPGRQRFTGGHELAHYALSHHNRGIKGGTLLHPSETGFRSDKQFEYEADVFSAHYLMPTAELLRTVRTKHWGAEEVLAVAEKFGSSVTSAALRCQKVLPGDSTLILWKNGEYSWSWSGGKWAETPSAPIRSVNQLVRDSATARALAAGTELREYFRSATTRSFWSKRIAHWSSQNDILIEYAISLGQYGVLTLLRPDQSI